MKTFFFAILCIITSAAVAQERRLLYDVMRNGKVIGKIDVTENVVGTRRMLILTSAVKTGFVFAFTDNTYETAGYENGVLMYSTFHQNQTGSSVANKSTIFAGSLYKVTDNAVSTMVNFNRIPFGMLMLYFHVPDTISKVFSGNYQKMLDIKKEGDNRYRLSIPDGKYNYYTYKNGICSKVEIIRTMVSLQFVLREEQIIKPK